MLTLTEMLHREFSIFLIDSLCDFPVCFMHAAMHIKQVHKNTFSMLK